MGKPTPERILVDPEGLSLTHVCWNVRGFLRCFGTTVGVADLKEQPAFATERSAMTQLVTDESTIRPSPTPDRRCPNCELPPRLLQSFLDTRANRMRRVFECSNCGKLIWDD